MYFSKTKSNLVKIITRQCFAAEIKATCKNSANLEHTKGNQNCHLSPLWLASSNVFVASSSMVILTSNLQNVVPAEVKIVVRDNVMLVPGHDVYILVNTSVTYSVIRLNRGKASGLFSLTCCMLDHFCGLPVNGNKDNCWECLMGVFFWGFLKTVHVSGTVVPYVIAIWCTHNLIAHDECYETFNRAFYTCMLRKITSLHVHAHELKCNLS